MKWIHLVIIPLFLLGCDSNGNGEKESLEIICDEPIGFSNEADNTTYGYLVSIDESVDVDVVATKYLEKYEDLEVFYTFSHSFHGNSSEATNLKIRCEPEVISITWNNAIGIN